MASVAVGGEFRYLHQLEDPDDRVAMLEFATVVEGKQVEGIDKLTFDAGGMITDLKVMIRPASALQPVGAKMAEEFPKVGLRVGGTSVPCAHTSGWRGSLAGSCSTPSATGVDAEQRPWGACSGAPGKRSAAADEGRRSGGRERAGDYAGWV